MYETTTLVGSFKKNDKKKLCSKIVKPRIVTLGLKATMGAT
jgi:hypothetical protein